MSVLSAQSIRKALVLVPCLPKYKRNGLSGGLSSASYDVSIAQDLIIWPGRFVLASTEEYFSMPDGVCAVVHDKSTWIRKGLALHNTFIDPGWKGYLTLELKMQAFRFFKIKKGTPIAQIVFSLTDQVTEAPYEGKYQYQEYGPQAPRETR